MPTPATAPPPPPTSVWRAPAHGSAHSWRAWSPSKRQPGRGAPRWGGSEFAGAGDVLPLALEEVLAAWARNPPEFETRARRLDDTLTALGAELAQATGEERDETAIARWAEVEAFWAAIRAAIGEDP